MRELVVVGSQPRLWELEDGMAVAAAQMLGTTGLPVHYEPGGRIIVNSPLVHRAVGLVVDEAGPEPWARELERWLEVSGGRLVLHRRHGEGSRGDAPPAEPTADGGEEAPATPPPGLPRVWVRRPPAGRTDGKGAQRAGLRLPLAAWLCHRQARRFVGELAAVLRGQGWRVGLLPLLIPPRGMRRCLQIRTGAGGLALTQALFLAVCRTLDPASADRRPLPQDEAGETPGPVRVQAAGGSRRRDRRPARGEPGDGAARPGGFRHGSEGGSGGAVAPSRHGRPARRQVPAKVGKGTGLRGKSANAFRPPGAERGSGGNPARALPPPAQDAGELASVQGAGELPRRKPFG